MPHYDYECPECGPFTLSRPMADYATPQACPDCAQESQRAFYSAPPVLGMDAGVRRAHSVNERSRHEPRLSSDSAASTKLHGSNCGCCRPGKAKKGVFTADGAKTFPSARPWMISH